MDKALCRGWIGRLGAASVSRTHFIIEIFKRRKHYEDQKLHAGDSEHVWQTLYGLYGIRLYVLLLCKK